MTASIPSQELAAAVARMLIAQGVQPAAEAVYVAPSLERDQITCPRLYVAPGDETSQVIDRSGRRRVTQSVEIALVAACDPHDELEIRRLLGETDRIAELVARHPPADETFSPIRRSAVTINREPLFSRDHLRAGVFLGTVTVEYP
jgi:hypothetical protein